MLIRGKIVKNAFTFISSDTEVTSPKPESRHGKNQS